MKGVRINTGLRIGTALLAGLVMSLHSASQPAPADAAQEQALGRYIAFVSGRMKEYIADYERDRPRGPDQATASRTLALAYDSAGRTADALAEIERAYQLAPAGQKMDQAITGQLIAMGARDEAKLRYWLAEMGRHDPARRQRYQELAADLASPATALASLQDRLRDPAAAEELMSRLAPWLAYFGDHAGALEALRGERLVSGLRGSTTLWLSLYRDVRNLPGFRQLVQEIGLVDQWLRTGWGDYCRPIGEKSFRCGSGDAGPIQPDKPFAGDGWRQLGMHRTRRVEVEKDVLLEVVDWGGTGRPLVLLAGLGGTAHVFDALAPKLTDQYHVYGVTRRGFGVSSAPATGYDADRLGDDVLAVIKALRLEKPVIAGHSIAGEELSSIGSRFPQRVAGLIYLDAHYLYAFHDAKVEELTEAYQAARRGPATSPAPPPFVLAPQDLAGEAILNGKRQYTRVRAPVLALMAGQQGTPNAADPEIVEAQKKVIRVAAPSARVVYIPAAQHYIFGSHEAEVLAEIRAFIASLE